MASRRSFLKRSTAAVGAMTIRLALPVGAVLSRCLSNLQRYGRPPYLRFNLLRHLGR